MPKKREPLPLPDFQSGDEEILFSDTHHPADYFAEPADLVIKLKRGKDGRPLPPIICPDPRYE